MIVIIDGAPASGKSKTAQYLFEHTQNSSYVDGDWLLATNPRDRNTQRSLRYKNIALLAKNYYESGFTNVFISFVYARQEDLQEQIDLVKNLDFVKVFALIPNLEVLQKRHAEDNYKRVDINQSIELNNRISKLKNIEIIDNSDMTIEETANSIKQKLS